MTRAQSAMQEFNDFTALSREKTLQYYEKNSDKPFLKAKTGGNQKMIK